MEVDETYVAGCDKNRHRDKKSGTRGRGDTGKTAIVGAVERKGNVVARVVENTSRLTLGAFVRETGSVVSSHGLQFIGSRDTSSGQKLFS